MKQADTRQMHSRAMDATRPFSSLWHCGGFQGARCTISCKVMGEGKACTCHEAPAASAACKALQLARRRAARHLRVAVQTAAKHSAALVQAQ